MKRVLKLSIAMTSALSAIILTLASLTLANTSTPIDGSVPESIAPPARPHTPNSGVYTLYDTIAGEPEAGYNWIEINNSADFSWNLGGDFIEDGNLSDSFPMGFFFPFYNDFYDAFRISEKGYIIFEQSGMNVGGTGIPATIPTNNLGAGDGANNFIAPFTGDLFGFPGLSQVYIRNDSSPRRTIIEFENVVWCCGQNNPRTFQVILYPDGSTDMQYLKITNFAGQIDSGQIVRTGLESLDGSAGDVYTQGIFLADDTGYWQDQFAIHYEPNFTNTGMVIFVPDGQTVWDDPGETITVTANLYLAASDSVTYSFNVMTSSLVVSSSTPASTWANSLTHTTSAPVISGTYTGTVQFFLTIPVSADFNDVATATFMAQAIENPLITDTFIVVYGPAQRDLQIQKALQPNIPPYPEGALRYRLTMTNTDYNNSNRGAVARSVVVTDILQAGITYEDDDCNCVTTATLGSETLLTMTLNNMGVNQTVDIFLELRNINPEGTPVTNTAHITTLASIELGDGPNNHDTATFSVANAPDIDLVINKYYPFNPNNVAAGQAIPYRLEFYNQGNTPVGDVVITDIIPENTVFSSATLSGHSPLVAGATGPITPTITGSMSRTLAFTIPLVDNGEWNHLHLEIWVQVPQTIPVGTYLTNTANINGQDSATQVIRISSSYVNPIITKEPSRDQADIPVSPEPGKDYTYWISYTNRSTTVSADNILITDTLPTSVTLVTASAGQYLTGPTVSTVSGETLLTWTGTSPIPPGESGRMIIIVHVDSNVPEGTPLVNQVVMTYTGNFTPSNPMDGTSTITTEVASDINGSEKQVNNPTPSAGQTIEYTIIVSNSNTSAGTTFTVTDALPPELTYVSHNTPVPDTGTVSAGAKQINWIGGTLGPNSQASLTFRAQVSETAPVNDVIRNTAIISDANGSRIARAVDVTVSGDIFGSSRKTANPSILASGDNLTYMIAVTNSGSSSSLITVTDSLPLSVTLVGGSFSEGVDLDSDNRTFTWTTTVLSNSNRTLTFQVTVTTGLTDGVTIDNVAALASSEGAVGTRLLTATVTISNSVTLAGDIYLPIIFKQG